MDYYSCIFTYLFINRKKWKLKIYKNVFISVLFFIICLLIDKKMFYYLLDKSSFLNNQDKTKKMTSILIAGTIIYIVFHFILSNLNNSNLTKYFWVLFCMDVAAVIINSKMD